MYQGQRSRSKCQKLRIASSIIVTYIAGSSPSDFRPVVFLDFVRTDRRTHTDRQTSSKTIPARLQRKWRAGNQPARFQRRRQATISGGGADMFEPQDP